MIEEKMPSILSQKKETVSMTRHLQLDLLMPDLLLLISAVFFNFLFIKQKYSTAEPWFSKSKVNLVQSSF